MNPDSTPQATSLISRKASSMSSKIKTRPRDRLSSSARRVGTSGRTMRSRRPLRRLQIRILARPSQTYGSATISPRRTIRGTAGIWSTPSSHLTKTEQPTSSFPSLGRTTPRAGAKTKKRRLRRVKTRPEPDPSAQRTTNQKSKMKTRAKHKLKKSNLVIVDVSKSSSHDQVPLRMKKRTTKSAIRTNAPASDRVKTANRKSQMT